jgi:hypothetical protein
MYAMCEIFNALKQNTKVGKVYIECDADGFRELARRETCFILGYRHRTAPYSQVFVLQRHRTHIWFHCHCPCYSTKQELIVSWHVHPWTYSCTEMVDVEWLLAKNEE